MSHLKLLKWAECALCVLATSIAVYCTTAILLVVLLQPNTFTGWFLSVFTVPLASAIPPVWFASLVMQREIDRLEQEIKDIERRYETLRSFAEKW